MLHGLVTLKVADVIIIVCVCMQEFSCLKMKFSLKLKGLINLLNNYLWGQLSFNFLMFLSKQIGSLLMNQALGQGSEWKNAKFSQVEQTDKPRNDFNIAAPPELSAEGTKNARKRRQDNLGNWGKISLQQYETWVFKDVQVLNR